MEQGNAANIALASIIGVMVYFVCYQLKLSVPIAELSAALSVIIIRVMAVKFHIHLPIL